jgi:hypothetical protein
MGKPRAMGSLRAFGSVWRAAECTLFRPDIELSGVGSGSVRRVPGAKEGPHPLTHVLNSIARNILGRVLPSIIDARGCRKATGSLGEACEGEQAAGRNES